MSQNLPTGWASATIPQLISATGEFSDGDWVESVDQDPSGDVRLIQLADVGAGEFLNKSSRFLTSEKAEQLRCTHLQKNDVLVARMPDPLGRACLFPGDEKSAVTVVDVCIVRPGAFGAYPRWLMWAINSPQFRAAVSSLQSGSTRKRISRSNLATLELPVPPRAEQLRIVNVLDERLCELDAAVRALRRAKMNTSRYRAAIIRDACEGRLSATESVVKMGSGQTAKEFASDLGLGNVAAVAPDTTHLPKTPRGWVVASLDQLMVRITSGSRDWSRYYGRGDGVFIMAQNVRPGRLDLSFRQAVDPPIRDRDRERSQVRKGDVLVTIVGANTGDTCLVPTQLFEHFVCQSVALMRPLNPELGPWIALWLSSPENGRRQFERYIYGAGRPHLSFDQLRMTAVLLPSPHQQAAILSEVEARIGALDRTDAEIDRQLARAVRLRESILKHAFEGKLVPQDTSEEPASILLERICRKRTTTTLAQNCREPRRKASR